MAATISITSPAADSAVDMTSTLTVAATGAGKGSTDDLVSKHIHQTIDFAQSSDYPSGFQVSPSQSEALNGWVDNDTFSNGSKNYSFPTADFSGLTNGETFWVGLNISSEAGHPGTHNTTARFDNRRFTGFNAVPDAVAEGTPTAGFNALIGTINWSATTGAQSYTIRLGTTSGGTDLVNDAAVPSGTSFDYALGAGSKNDEIFVRVDAVNILGTTEGTIWSFDTQGDPIKPVIDETNTANGATDTGRQPELNWTDGGSDATAATKYDVFLGTSNPPVIEVSSDQVGLSFISPTNLDPGQTYFWFVRAQNDVGSSSSEDIWSFTVAAAAAGAPATKSFSKKLVAAANGQFFYETDDTPLSLMTALPGLTLDTSEEIQMTEAYQKIFIANGTIKKVVDFSNVKIEFSAISDSDKPTPGMIFTQATTTASMVLDYWDGTNDAIYGFQTTTADFTNLVVITLPAMTVAPEPGDTLTQNVTNSEMVVTAVNVAKTEITGTVTVADFDGTNTFTSDDLAGPTMNPSPATPTSTTDIDLTGTNSAGATVTIHGFEITTVTKPTVPHHYDWGVFGALPGTYGALPPLCNIIALYYGRVVISGNPNDPHQWFMSRQFRPFDFLFVQLDAQSPVAGANTKAGKLGDIITALIAYQDDYLIFGCSQSVWFMRGDPAAGGTIDLLTRITGIFGKRSWTWGEDGVLYFFGTNGIYRVGRNFSTIENLTLDKLPTLVEDLGLDPDTDTVTMGYDQRHHGLNISITVAATGSNNNFFYSLLTEGFFPETYPTEDGVHSMWYYNADEPNSRKLMLGCNDGSIRKFDDDNKSDDNGTDAAASTTAISSEVLLGPQRLSRDDNRKVLLKRVRVTTGGGGADGTQPDTDSLSYEAYGDDTGAGVLEKYDAGTFISSGTISVPGSSASLPLRLKAAFMGFKLFNDTLDETWAFENLFGEAEKRGRVR